MPADILTNIPDQSDVFVDANIFVYAFTGMSRDCKEFLARCARQDVFGITSYDTINEVTHRLMVNEAYEKGLISKPRGRDLQARPELVRTLTDYWAQVAQVFSMNLVIVPAEETILLRAQRLRAAHGLLTLDSVLLAAIEEYGIQRLASHDTDFDAIGTLTVYHASDIP